MKNEIKNIAVLSLLDNNTEVIREKLNIYTCDEFINHIAQQKKVTPDQAKTIILNNSELMKIMFSIA